MLTYILVVHTCKHICTHILKYIEKHINAQIYTIRHKRANESAAMWPPCLLEIATIPLKSHNIIKKKEMT